MERESMEFDVVIVGAGPAGLAAAIRLRQLALAAGREVSVCVLEKGSEVGAHILSGAVIETRALDELLPDWKAKGAPLNVPAKDDRFLFLTEKGAYRLPTPPQMHNEGNYVVSLANVCRWLGEQAEALGVEVFPGFAAAEVLYDEDGRVKGVATGDMGITKAGEEGPNHQPGMELHARLTLFGEGCRGSLTRTLFDRFDLRKDCQPQTYGLGKLILAEITAHHLDDPNIVKTDSCAVPDHPIMSRFWMEREPMETLVIGLNPRADRNARQVAAQMDLYRQTRDMAKKVQGKLRSLVGRR